MNEYERDASSQDGAVAVLNCAATQVCPVSAQLCSRCAGSCHASGMVQSCGHDAYLWREVTYVVYVGCCCCVTLHCHALPSCWSAAPATELGESRRPKVQKRCKATSACPDVLHNMTESGHSCCCMLPADQSVTKLVSSLQCLSS